MIVVSLLLILVAVTLLVLGLVGGSSILLISSIVASLLAAVALVVGARQAAAARRARVVPADERAFEDDLPRAREEYDEETTRSAAAYTAGRRDAEEHLAGPDATQRVRPDADLYDDAVAGRTSSGQAAGPASPESADFDPPPPGPEWPVADGAESAPLESDRDSSREAEFDEPDPDDPDDEPLPQAVRPADAVRVAQLDAEVLVVDGRPRYHLADCPHLAGRSTEGLPVAEAVELGFSPCGQCRPVDRLVAAAARR